MQATPPRPISHKEMAVVLAALRQAPVGDVSVSVLASIPMLWVIGRCECGCDSVTFSHEPVGGNRIADGIGKLVTGEDIGVLIWANAGAVFSLEVYNFSDESARLPEPESIGPYGKGCAR